IYFGAGENTANLHLFTKCQDIRAGFFAKMLMRPELSGQPYTGLYFIIDQEAFIFIGKQAKLFEKLLPDMVIATFRLYRLYNDGADIIFVIGKSLPDLDKG